MKKDFKLELYRSGRKIFLLRDIAILTGDNNPGNLKARVNYYVSRGVLRNIRRGVYAKPGYSSEELACRLYSPSYVSLETVLQKEGIIFQYSSAVTAVSYLSRTLIVDSRELAYRKIRNSVLINTAGVSSRNYVNIACKERACLDALYLYGEFYFDNISNLDRTLVSRLLEIYNCRALEKRAERILKL